MRKQKAFNWNYLFSHNKKQNVTSFYYKMYDWIEIDFKYGDGVPSSRITNEIILQSEYKVIQTGTVWQNGYVTNETTGRKLGMSVNNKGRGRIKVCPPKFILGNNAQEVSIKETFHLFEDLSHMIGIDLGDAIIRSLDVTHTAITDFTPEAYFPYLCNQTGQIRWQLDTTLYYGKNGGNKKNSKKFYDKTREVDTRKTWGGRQTMPLELKGKELTRFEVGLGNHRSTSKVIGQDACLGHLFMEESVEKLHNHWLDSYSTIPKNTDINFNYIAGMGAKEVQDELIFKALANYGRINIENEIELAFKMGAFKDRQSKYYAKKNLLKAFEDRATPNDLMKELDRKILGVEPLWE